MDLALIFNNGWYAIKPNQNKPGGLQSDAVQCPTQDTTLLNFIAILESIQSTNIKPRRLDHLKTGLFVYSKVTVNPKYLSYVLKYCKNLAGFKQNKIIK